MPKQSLLPERENRKSNNQGSSGFLAALSRQGLVQYLFMMMPSLTGLVHIRLLRRILLNHSFSCFMGEDAGAWQDNRTCPESQS